MIEGNIDLQEFDNFHYGLDYQLHPNPQSGFEILNNESQKRYNLDSLISYIGRDIPNCVTDCVCKNFNLNEISLSVQKMLPGMILPYHSDKFNYYLSQYPNLKINQIKRVIIFLEDWKAGHISEIDGASHTNWKKGDWISWIGATPHLAANLGFEDRYTLQITGIIK